MPVLSLSAETEGKTLFNEERESHDLFHPHWLMILVTWRSIRTECSDSCCAPTSRFIKLIKRKEGGEKTIKRDAISPFSPLAPIRLSVRGHKPALATADQRGWEDTAAVSALSGCLLHRVICWQDETACCPSADLHVCGVKLQLRRSKGTRVYKCTSS